MVDCQKQMWEGGGGQQGWEWGGGSAGGIWGPELFFWGKQRVCAMWGVGKKCVLLTDPSPPFRVLCLEQQLLAHSPGTPALLCWECPEVLASHVVSTSDNAKLLCWEALGL